MHGLYLLWWVEEKQLPPGLVAAVLAAGDLAVAILELPTGWFADRFGHRRSLIAGSSIQVAGMLWCWLGDGVDGLLTASVLVATGDALRSGAHQALLFRSCTALGCRDEFQRIEARASAVELCALIALTVAGGVIVTAWGFAAGWIAETLLCAVGLAIAFALTEPPAAAEFVDPAAPSAWHRLFAARMVALVLPAAVVAAGAGGLSFVAQTSGMYGPHGTAIVVATTTLAEVAGSATAIRMRERGALQQLALSAGGVAIILLTLVFPSAITAAAVALSFITGVAAPLRAAAVQQLAVDDQRARAASLVHACDMALSTLTLPLAGVWSGRRAT